MKQNYEKLMADMKSLRKGIIDPDSKEHMVLSERAIIQLFASEEFGNFLTLSTIYNELEKAK